MNSDYCYVIPPDDYPGKRYQNGRYAYEHHVIWWENTGECVPKGFLIHHRNENKRDNRFENFELLLPATHAGHHAQRPIRHGSKSAYSHHGCRCDECRGAQIKRMKEYRARRNMEKI